MGNLYGYKNGMAADASLIVNSRIPVGMVRKTVYRFENFAPLEIPLVKSILGESLYNEIKPSLDEHIINYDGELRIPIGRILEALGNKVTASIQAALFSKPIWEMEVPNLVVMAGLTDSLDKHFKGSAYTAAWYVGLVSGTPTFAEGNTMATHPGWFEVVPYAGARPTLTLGTVVSGSVDNSASKAVYTINATMVVGGGFLTTLPTAGQTSGTLYGGAAFSGGNRSVSSGDTLNVTVTLTATAA